MNSAIRIGVSGVALSAVAPRILSDDLRQADELNCVKNYRRSRRGEDATKLTDARNVETIAAGTAVAVR